MTRRASLKSESDSHENTIRRPKSVCLDCSLFEIKDTSISPPLRPPRTDSVSLDKTRCSSAKALIPATLRGPCPWQGPGFRSTKQVLLAPWALRHYECNAFCDFEHLDRQVSSESSFSHAGSMSEMHFDRHASSESRSQPASELRIW